MSPGAVAVLILGLTIYAVAVGFIVRGLRRK